MQKTVWILAGVVTLGAAVRFHHLQPGAPEGWMWIFALVGVMGLVIRTENT